MINKKKNVRVQLTLSKQQFNWLENFAKAKGITISKLVAWLLTKKSREVVEAIDLNNHPEEAVSDLEDEEHMTDAETLELVNKIRKRQNQTTFNSILEYRNWEKNQIKRY